jgi:hypothetical protein
VIAFDWIVRILIYDMAGDGQQLVEHSLVGGRSVGAHLRSDVARRP